MILVTGANGFLGAHLLYKLVRKGLDVKALCRNNSDIEFVRKTFSHYCSDFDALFDSIRWLEGDLLDHFSLREALQGVEMVFNCAGKVSFNATDKGRIDQGKPAGYPKSGEYMPRCRNQKTLSCKFGVGIGKVGAG